MALPSAREREAFIRAYALQVGIDPDVAVKVARGEGLRDGVWQSELQQPYGREQSYGDFQLHTAPEGHRPGLGNTFQKTTGMNPADPANWQAMDRFALDQARKQGWGPWMGAKAQGITGYHGIGGQAPAQLPVAEQGAGTSMGGYAEGPAAVAQRMPNGGLLDPDEDPIMAGSTPFGGDSQTWVDLGKLAEQYAKDHATSEDEQLPPPLPILQPLRRIQLGKGLLG